ncbi:pilus assembly protein [Pseudomonas sp. SP16.1]|uniref:pilus assembly protein n=1 Tax=Pseudomonas sp. SP16.1 TaxID=3458854 RepID=UPI004045DAD1
MDSLACRYHTKLLHAGCAFLLSLAIGGVATARADVSQSPLLLGGGSVPGNLALVPSVEWPTIISMANLGAYSVNNSYVGYFDSNKCYGYSHDATNADRRDSHFYPHSITSNRSCSGNLWSGNFLNWAATQTIDPFRSALTGGYRVKDTPTETWLEKARHTGQNGSGAREISGGSTIRGATPANWSSFRTRLAGLGNRMRFTLDGDLNGTATDYTADTDLAGNGSSVYEVVMRVKVCDAGVGLETNCKQYSQGYKPEGLIQQYASDIRYSVFGYLNDHEILRDGGVLRAKQKFVGQTVRAPGVAGNQNNPANEWDATTGVLVRNPNAADATATNATILDSGVINYLNKFGQMTSKNHKSIDPVSELFYTALRYFKNQGNVSAYSELTGDADNRYRLADGFPVITSWDDPIQYACQKNVILGIGDTNSHRDKNLPGNTNMSEEPATPGEVTADDSINVVTATQKVAALEGITINTPFTGRNNSAYIAGLAYDANTRDLRPLVSGKQTVSTYWVDVRENESLAGRVSNQYWLAAKYGGFKVPSDFGDPYARTTALPTTWWRTTTDMLGTNYPRPDNFYVASDAAKMVESLKLAFAQIAKEAQSTTASLAANSTRLATDTAVFQSLLDSKRWSGDLLAKRIGSDGSVASEASWSAAAALDSLTNLSARKVFTSLPPTADSVNGPLRSTDGVDFTWSDLAAAQRAALTKAGEADSSMAENRLAFLRGDRSREITDDDAAQPFRQRGSRLGDIVNSDPQFIHKQDFGYSRLSWSNGAVGTAYTAFRATTAYQNRTPMVVVGANDGMLHGFDARVSATAANNGGGELFAYVPNNLFGNLINLTEPAYAHRYYVDATPRISDVWLGASTGWRTMVVGATGAGGNSVFALDITDPGSMTSNSVMWEFSHPRMGYTLGQPALVALPNGRFGVIVSSGYHDSAQTDGKVWVLDAADGSVIKEFTLATSGGLGGPLASDTDADQVADRVYVADTLGNLWRLDLAGSNTSSWRIPASLNANPLFIAKDDDGARQAITAPLASAFNDKGQHMVFFGTGSFYRTGDNEVPADPAVDSYYGIIDGGLLIDGRGALREQEILREATLASGEKARAITQNAMQSGDKGWYLDLVGPSGAQGERVVAKATLRSDRVIFTSMTPSADPCAFGGTSWIMSLNLSSGGRLNYVYFDSNGDGDLDGDDTTSIDDQDIPWSGISDVDAGVSKGVTSLYKWLCFAGSSGATPTCIPQPDSQRFGRQSWREVGDY